MPNKYDPILGEYRQNDATISVDNASYIKLDQNNPQTVANGIPLLDQPASAFTQDDEFVNKAYVDAVVQEVVYVPNSITLNTGTYVSGNVASVQTLSDGDYYIVDEVAGVPGFNIEFPFINVQSFSRLWCHVYYAGSGSHVVQIRLWNYTDSSWDVITGFTLSDDFQFIEIPVTDTNYIDGSGNAKVSLYHITSGNASHQISVDYIALAKAGMGSVNDHGALVGLSDDDHTQYWKDGVTRTGDYTTTGEITGEMAKVQAGEPALQVGNLWLDPSETAVDTTDHNALTNKDYASSGHTGFEPEITAGTSAQFLKGDKSLDSSVYLTTGYVNRGDPSATDYTLSAFTTDGSYHDLDLSSIVPAGATSVHLYVLIQDDATSSSLNFRKNGNSNLFNRTRTGTQVSNVPMSVDIICSVDSSRIIEYIATNTTFSDIQVTVKGWFL